MNGVGRMSVTHGRRPCAMMAAKTEPDATTNGFADVTPTASATATAFLLVDHLSRPIQYVRLLRAASIGASEHSNS